MFKRCKKRAIIFAQLAQNMFDNLPLIPICLDNQNYQRRVLNRKNVKRPDLINGISKEALNQRNLTKKVARRTKLEALADEQNPQPSQIHSNSSTKGWSLILIEDAWQNAKPGKERQKAK